MANETKRRIPYVNLAAQYAEERDELLPIIDGALTTGQFVGGEPIEALEHALRPICGAEHVVALNSGTDALIMGMAALGIGAGDEVITPPNSFVASTAAIVALGAQPVFADVLDDQNIDPEKVEKAVTSRTKAIMPVHLTGRIADMDPIVEIAEKHGLKIIEDAAQAIGSLYRDRPSGSFGDVGCFSGHPLKNLNACGDAGFVSTNDARIADAVRLMRNHGLADRNTVTRFGAVSRLDTLQAVILNFRIAKMPSIIERRRTNAARYARLLDAELVFLPPERQHEFNTYHTLVIQIDHRDELQTYLAQAGVGTAIHYPIPIHLQPAAASLGHKKGDFPVTERQAERILTLPIHPWLSDEDIAFVSDTVNDFLREKATTPRAATCS
ncbi:MAG TPA: DegT/DnrJ/EryC1/StrS family aminotransferase [Xanthobacteraceae bacterium]|nr:DegT/DnrJ/EryC1/StrS family aminotransferase [Xanthobacteraceae bacterium]